VQRALVDGKNIAPASSFGKSLAALAEQLGEPYRKEGRSGRQERERFVGRQDHFFLVAQEVALQSVA
jgi:hypothetical protein